MNVPRPYALLAELTYQCPLHCPYCSNPTQQRGGELSTAEWISVVQQAATMGVLQAGFSGGEPLARPDLEPIIAAARADGLYTNLLTSGIGLTAPRAASLRAAGLDSLQLSLQADEATLADHIAGAAVHTRKLHAAQLAREAGFPLSLNVVLHRANLDRLPEIITLAERLGATRLELANTQYYGWAMQNRAALLPTRAQVERALVVAQAAQARLRGQLEIFYVLPDYYQATPKACLHGWGQRYLTVNPVGEVLPCPTASSISGLVFENVRTRPLREIWADAASFTQFRGTGWLPEPCQSCPQREVDFGGCRCQAALVLGDAAQPDPVCVKTAGRAQIDAILAEVERHPAPAWAPRQNPRALEVPSILPAC